MKVTLSIQMYYFVLLTIMVKKLHLVCSNCYDALQLVPMLFNCTLFSFFGFEEGEGFLR